MQLRLGIGIATYNRRQVVSATLDRVMQHTKYPLTTIGVADDGSDDGTVEMLSARGNLTAVHGRNMGIAWNKNRALFLLTELLRCDIVILLEDDAFPTSDHWEREWMDAALRWGHANMAGEWFRESFLSGSGTLEDPILSPKLTAQCAVFSREALLFGGYFDTRFRGYGHEHVEHSRRLARAGYGGVDLLQDGQPLTAFRLLWSCISSSNATSYFDRDQADRNVRLARELMGNFGYRAPWQDEEEMQQFREEMRAATPPVL